MDKKIIGIKFYGEVNFETPINEDDFRRLHEEFASKLDEVFGIEQCRSMSYPIYE